MRWCHKGAALVVRHGGTRAPPLRAAWWGKGAALVGQGRRGGRPPADTRGARVREGAWGVQIADTRGARVSEGAWGVQIADTRGARVSEGAWGVQIEADKFEAPTAIQSQVREREREGERERGRE